MTERTGGKRPDYKELNRGSRVLIKSQVRRRHGGLPLQSLNAMDSDDDQVRSGSQHFTTEEGDKARDLPTLNNQPPRSSALLSEATGGGDRTTDNGRITDEESLRRKQSEDNHKLIEELRAAEDERQLRDKLEKEKQERLSWMDRTKHDAYNEESARNQDHQDYLIRQLIGQAESISEDIDCFIEENPPADFGNSIEDLDKIINRIEDMRSSFRGKHKEIRAHCTPGLLLGKSFNATLEAVKLYLKQVRDKRKSLRDGEDVQKLALVAAKQEKLVFLGKEVRRTISDLYVTFSSVLDDESDENITKRKEELPGLVKIVNKIPKRIEEIMDAGEIDAEINKIKTRFDNLIKAKTLYVTRLDDELKKREIEKLKSFKTSSLNIKLAKFKGYSSSLDIYTFRMNFERFVSSKSKVGEVLWLSVIEFLENELTIAQEKIVIFQKPKDKEKEDKSDKDTSSKKTYRTDGGSKGNNSNSNPTHPQSITVCAIC